MVDGYETRRPSKVDVSLSADEIAMGAVLLLILAGSLALIVGIMADGADSVVGFV